MWTDLDSQVAEIFAEDAPPALDFLGQPARFYLLDPHPDADRWLAASEEERQALAPIYEAKLVDLIRERARVPIKRKRVRAGYMRAWRTKNRERENAKQREYRAKKAAQQAALQ